MTPIVAVVGFMLVLVLGAYLAGASPISARILAPVYAPLVVIAFALFEGARDEASVARRNWLATAVAGAFLVWAVLVVVWAVALVWDHGRAPRGYASDNVEMTTTWK